MRKFLLGALVAVTCGLGVAAVAPAAPAQAQGVVITPDGVRIYPGDQRYDRYDRRYRRSIDRRDAAHIAQRNGVGRVRDINEYSRHFVVRGDARRGRGELRLTIDKRSGRVERTERIINRR